MKGKIFLIFMTVMLLVSTSSVKSIKILDNKDNNNNLTLTNSGKFLDIALADISPYNGVKVIFSDGNGEYTASQNHKAGGDPEKVISEDFNRDGLDDLAVIDYVSGNLCILLQKASGGFKLQDNQLYTGVGPKNLISGDFNPDKDSYVDIAVITMGGEYVNQYSLNIFLGDGYGGFSKAASAPYRFNNIPNDLTTGDFNQDGALDIAVLSNSILIYLNKNTRAGDFEYYTSIPSGESWRITSGDFNNDGFCDLATTNTDHLGEVDVFLGNPDESDFFEDYAWYPVHGSTPNGLTTGDFDRDGYLDIAVANGAYSRSVSVLLNDNGDGFGLDEYNVGYKTVCNIISGDVNKDGKTDLVVAAITDTESGGVSILFGDSEGKFTRTSLDNYKGSYWGIAVGEFGEFNNKNPDAPIISGPKSGEPGQEYKYTFKADDPEDDYIKFEIDWGEDGSQNEETSLSDNDTKIKSHTWDDQGAYTIRARAIDNNGGKSGWATLDVSMPKTRSLLLNNWIQSLIDRFLGNFRLFF